MAPAQTVQGNEGCGLPWSAQADHRGDSVRPPSHGHKTEMAYILGGASVARAAEVEEKPRGCPSGGAPPQRVLAIVDAKQLAFAPMLSVAKAMGKEALCAARPLHRGCARRLRATTALPRVRRRSAERRRARALLAFGTQGGWALEAWRLRSAPHYSASACACRPSPPASSRVQDQGHGH